MINVSGLVVHRGDRLVLEDVGVHVERGAVVGIVGPNGAGKSTMIEALYRGLSISAGRVVIDSGDIATLSRRELAREVAVVTQDGDTAMPLTVADAVLLGRLPHRSLLGYGDAHDRHQVSRALDRVGLRGFEDRIVTKLSGGERQRALIARAIVQDAPCLLLDEPTNHLDIHHQFALLDLVASLDTTTVMVLHDLNLAARFCDQVVLVEDGHVVASGPPSTVFDPDIVGRVYHVRVHRTDSQGRTMLMFDPLTTGDTP